MGMWQRAVQAAANMLREGATVTPRALAETARLTVPEDEAYRAWLINLTRSAAHEAGQQLGIPVMALGAGRGYKRPESQEELIAAERRSKAQVKGQAKRWRALKRLIVDPNQMRLPLDNLKEVAADASATDTARESHAS